MILIEVFIPSSPVIVDHSDVIEADERPVGSHSEIVVVPRVDGQTFGFHELPTKLCQID